MENCSWGTCRMQIAPERSQSVIERPGAINPDARPAWYGVPEVPTVSPRTVFHAGRFLTAPGSCEGR
eukprot:3979546-Pyramimonas_sp.AAC.1